MGDILIRNIKLGVLLKASTKGLKKAINISKSIGFLNLLGTDILKFFQHKVNISFDKWELYVEQTSLVNGFLLSSEVIEPNRIMEIPDMMRDSNSYKEFSYTLHNKCYDNLDEDLPILYQRYVARVYDCFRELNPEWDKGKILYTKAPKDYIYKGNDAVQSF